MERKGWFLLVTEGSIKSSARNIFMKANGAYYTNQRIGDI